MNADLRVQCLQRNISKILFIPHHRQTDMNPIQRLYYFSSVFSSERFHRDRGDAEYKYLFYCYTISQAISPDSWRVGAPGRSRAAFYS